MRAAPGGQDWFEAPPVGLEVVGQPQHNRPSKSTKCVLGFLFVGAVFGIFLLVRINVMGCGCPAAFSNNYAEGTSGREDCGCNGDAFSCRYDCGGQLYCGQELCPGQQPSNTSSSSGGGGGGGSHPAGTVMCPGYTMPDYCDCNTASGGDCVEATQTRCICAEATAANCCNSGSG